MADLAPSTSGKLPQPPRSCVKTTSSSPGFEDDTETQIGAPPYCNSRGEVPVNPLARKAVTAVATRSVGEAPEGNVTEYIERELFVAAMSGRIRRQSASARIAMQSNFCVSGARARCKKSKTLLHARPLARNR